VIIRGLANVLADGNILRLAHPFLRAGVLETEPSSQTDVQQTDGPISMARPVGGASSPAVGKNLTDCSPTMATSASILQGFV